MPRNGSGIYSLPSYLAVTGQTITAAQHNTPLEDIATEITASLPRAGTAAMTGNLQMGSNNITGLADPSSAQHAATKAYVDTAVAAGLPADGDYGSITVSSTGTVWTVDAGSVTFDMIATAAKASAANLRAGAASVLVTPDVIESAAEPVTIDFNSGSPAWAWSDGINFELTLTGDAELAFPTAVEPGTWRAIRVIQNISGGHTTTLDASVGFYTVSGSALDLDETLSTSAIVFFYAVSTSVVYVFPNNGPFQEVT